MVTLGVFLISSCKKSKDNSIAYPPSIFFGQNLLSMPDSAFLQDGATYDMGAILGKDAELRIEFTNLSISDSNSFMSPVWYFSQSIGWQNTMYDDFSTPNQKFMTIENGRVNMQFLFYNFGGSGKCKMDMYENSNHITQTKYLFW